MSHQNPGQSSPPRPGTGRRLCILVVEDMPPVRETLRRMLTGGGHDVVAVADGRQALQVAEEPMRRIDVVVADLSLPDMHGRDLVAAIWRLRPGLRSVLVSGFGHDKDSVPRGGPACFLQKPFEQETLLRAVVGELQPGTAFSA